MDYQGNMGNCMVACVGLMVTLGAALGVRFRALILLPVTIIASVAALASGMMADRSLAATVFALFALAACLQGGYLAGLCGREWFRTLVDGARRADSRPTRIAPPVG